jgi:hypothetical protein
MPAIPSPRTAGLASTLSAAPKGGQATFLDVEWTISLSLYFFKACYQIVHEEGTHTSIVVLKATRTPLELLLYF